MAIIKKYNPNIIYTSERLEKSLGSLTEYSLTIAEAPTGYGKSTTIREYLKKNNIPYIWFNIDSDDKEKFYTDFCSRINSVSEECCHKMMAIGYPSTIEDCRKISKALMEIEFREPTVLVIDNYHFISGELSNNIITDLSNNTYSKLKVVCLTQAITSRLTLELVLKKKLNYIGKEDFELSKEEIGQYFKSCGIKLEEDETEFLYRYTEGWISALYLQMLSYVSTNSFEPTVDIDNLVYKAIWDNLTGLQQDFLICMSVFDSFTIRQALYVFEGNISEEQVNELIEKSGFIKYDPKSRRYYIHTILKYFLDNEFEKLEAVFRKGIFKGAGDWFKANESYIEAINYYYKIKDYESILEMEVGLHIFNKMNINNKANKLMIIDIIEKSPVSVKKKYTKNYIVYLYLLFIYNKRDMLKNELDNIQIICENIENDEITRNQILGNLNILKGFAEYNNLSLMKSYFDKGYEFLKTQSDIFGSIGSCTFFCPSVLSMYHRTCGSVEAEVKALEEMMPVFYKLTDGREKGKEAVMKAEALFMTGNFDDAAKLCNKAIYMAETRHELSIYICANLILARISFFLADYTSLNNIVEGMYKKLEEEERYDLSYMIDLSAGYIHMLMDQLDQVPGWLKSVETIEENCTIHNLGFANLIYGRYLISQEEYEMYESIAGQFLSIADIFSNVMYRIYNCIYLSIAKFNRHDSEKANKLLREALDYAIEDKIIVPFVENINYLTQTIGEIELDNKYREFIKDIKNYSKKYTRGLKAVVKASKNDRSYGLTNRELEVAKLAAQRLSNKEIADMLFIAESTVKSNLKIVFSKLGINSRNELKNYF